MNDSMNIEDIESEFKSDLKNGFEPAEWYESEIKWMIATIKKQEKEIEKYKNNIQFIGPLPKKKRVDY